MAFVERYGAYLKLPISLAYAGFVESEKLMQQLLELAKNDKQHRLAMQELSKSTLVLYEAVSMQRLLVSIRRCV